MNDIVISITIHEGVPDDPAEAQDLCTELEASLAKFVSADFDIFHNPETHQWNGMPAQVYAAVRSRP